MNGSSPRIAAGPTLPRVRDASLGDPPSVRVEALEVVFEVVCAGSRAEELLRAVETAWDWCPTDTDVPATHRVVVLLEDNDEALAAAAGDADLFGTDLATVMD